MNGPTDNTYNGWTNHATWNIALWIGGDEGLYLIAKECQKYSDFAEQIRETSEGSPIAFETPDKVAWNDSALDISALDEYIAGL